nr:MAG TPA: hypothetical protein [Caudoviricetes sp.]
MTNAYRLCNIRPSAVEVLLFPPHTCKGDSRCHDFSFGSHVIPFI